MVSWYKQAQEQDALQKHLEMLQRGNEALGFGFSDQDREEATRRFNRKPLNKESKEKGIEIILYRNFDANMNEIDKDANGNWVISPRKSEQGVIWFAHNLQRQPEQYYDRGGKYLLTYPLQATYRYVETMYDDGSSSQEPLTEGDIPTENSSTWAGYQLPEGFKFSYKTQKHIICEKDLVVPPNYITEAGNELV